MTKPTRSTSKLTRDLHVVSLFSGCGGMDLGFEGDFSVLKSSINENQEPQFIQRYLKDDFVQLRKTRFKTVFANDILKEARNAWVHHFAKRGHPSNTYRHDSIVDLVKQHLNGEQVFPKKVDVVIGGFPCQDFSLAGKRNGFKSHKNHKGEIMTDHKASAESRGQLYMWMKQVIEITQPNIFIAENVKGLVNLANVKDIIQKDFATAGNDGYIVLNPQVLHAANYGVPQSRERVFFIGIKKSALTPKALKELGKEKISNSFNPYPKPSHSYNIEGEDLKKPVQLQELFKTIQEPSLSDDLSQKSYSKAKFMGVHCQGQIEIKPMGISPTIRAEHHGNIEFRRLSKLNEGVQWQELDRGLKERRLTPRECALIQTFPMDYEFVIPKENGGRNRYLVSPSMAYKVIGNAVPPLLAFHLANRLEQVWDLYFQK